MQKMGGRYETVIIGGGITGAAIAYCLAAFGRKRTLLVERGFPATGATSKAATLISLARSTAAIIPYVRETWRQIDTLAAGKPGTLGACRVGAVHAASSPEGIGILDRTREVSLGNGVCGKEIQPRLLREKLPWLSEQAIAKAFYYEDEGYVDGYLLTTAYLNAAKMKGAQVVSLCAATAIHPLCADGYEIETERGNFHARNVVVAAGAWSNLLLESLGASIPFAPVRSQYWITGIAPELFPPRQPICILPDAGAYTRPENGALVFGWREPESVHIDPHALPQDTAYHRFVQDPDGWENLEGCVSSLEVYFPGLAEQGISRYISGCSTYTPDGLFNVGEITGFPGLYAAAGCSGMGIAVCGGIGRVVAESISAGRTALPVDPFSPNRFSCKNVFAENFMRSCADARAGKKTG